MASTSLRKKRNDVNIWPFLKAKGKEISRCLKLIGTVSGHVQGVFCRHLMRDSGEGDFKPWWLMRAFSWRLFEVVEGYCLSV